MQMLYFISLLIPLFTPTTALPSGPDPPVQARPPSGTVDHLNAYCQMSLYNDGHRSGESWSGWPLSYSIDDKDVFNYDAGLNNQCVNIFELNPRLTNAISSFVVTGWCECEFFGRLECQEPLFAAFNREDGSLWDRKSGYYNPDDTIESYRCWYTQREQDFDFCTVTWQGVDPWSFREVHQAKQVVWETGPRWQDVIERRDIGECRTLPDKDSEEWQAISSIVINGCTCNLYSEENCVGEGLGSFGNSGNVIVKDDFSPVFFEKGIKSYMCFFPVGIPTAVRTDFDIGGKPGMPPEVRMGWVRD
ncbi:hypothetical protein TWF730_002150 [Orbilia blumenaviensis]|uniref:Uncharacterized protein n=1 Tax=Orbilia blumenaviensis TaxID=1796055 RepID=A0AAV9UH52_9PEZI